MSPEIIKATGKAVNSTISALYNQPLVLALIVLQVLVLLVVLYSSIRRQEAVTTQFKHVFELIEKCLERSK